MRASSLVLGPLVARTGRARVSLPGGCAIGSRPINLHVSGLEKLGATVRQEHGYIEAAAPAGLRGAEVFFDRITVTGTEDLLMAAVLALGETVINNAAREPEVVDLAELLVKMGAEITGAGTSTIRVKGVGKLRGASHTIIPDRIEAGTFLIAGAITKGDVTVTGCAPEHLRALISKIEESGAEVTEPEAGALRVRVKGKLRSADMTTEEHPGFATDLQAQFMALMTQAEGIAIITETIFENRFMHAQELARMGANIRLDGRRAIVAGRSELSGAQVRPWCWRGWPRRAKRRLTACTTSTAAMRESSRNWRARVRASGGSSEAQRRIFGDCERREIAREGDDRRRVEGAGSGQLSVDRRTRGFGVGGRTRGWRGAHRQGRDRARY